MKKTQAHVIKVETTAKGFDGDLTPTRMSFQVTLAFDVDENVEATHRGWIAAVTDEAPVPVPLFAEPIALSSGQPFQIVGTEAAKEALDRIGLLDPLEAEILALREVLAHRDHLAAQVTELQEANTALLLRARAAEGTGS